MKGTQKTKKELIDELNSLKQRVTELEAVGAEHTSMAIVQRSLIVANELPGKAFVQPISPVPIVF